MCFIFAFKEKLNVFMQNTNNQLRYLDNPISKKVLTTIKQQ